MVSEKKTKQKNYVFVVHTFQYFGIHVLFLHDLRRRGQNMAKTLPSESHVARLLKKQHDKQDEGKASTTDLLALNLHTLLNVLKQHLDK